MMEAMASLRRGVVALHMRLNTRETPLYPDLLPVNREVLDQVRVEGWREPNEKTGEKPGSLGLKPFHEGIADNSDEFESEVVH